MLMELVKLILLRKGVHIFMFRVHFNGEGFKTFRSKQSISLSSFNILT